MAENNKTTSAAAEEDVDALLESCEKLLSTDKPNKDGAATDSGAQGSQTEKEKLHDEISKTLGALGEIGTEFGGDFARDLKTEFEKAFSEADSSGEAGLALEGLSDLMNVLQMVVNQTEGSNEADSLDSVSANFRSADSNIQANLPKFAAPQENSDNSTSQKQEEELDQLQDKMQSMISSFSKDIFRPALVSMSEQYPKWLAENKPKLSEADAHQYEQQHEIVKSILAHMDKPDAGNKQENMITLAVLLEKMQSLGAPPEGLLENDPLANFDSSAALDQCSLM